MQHSPQLTDITLHHKNTKKSYLSLKFDNTLTFVNSGVARYFFPATEMATGALTNPTGIAVLKALGIENEKFCKVFKDYTRYKVQQRLTILKMYQTKSTNKDYIDYLQLLKIQLLDGSRKRSGIVDLKN